MGLLWFGGLQGEGQSLEKLGQHDASEGVGHRKLDLQEMECKII